MKVDFKHSTAEKGMLKKKQFYKLEIFIELTEEEKAIIEDNDWKDAVIVEEEFDPFLGLGSTFRVSACLYGKFFMHATSKTDIQAYEQLALESLKNFKAHLEAGGEDLEDKSIEL